VRRIFEDYVNGKSPRAIATALNAEGIPSPRGGQWNASTINGNKARRNGILHNELYIGYLTYNRQSFRKDPETGKRQARPNPPSEWEMVEVPELRIIDDDLWERAQALNRVPLLKPLIDIPRMSALAQSMVKDGLDAFVNRDVDLCRQVARRDEEVDLLRDQIFRELLTYMHTPGQPDTVDRAIYLILVSRDLERIGDHASDIAENVCYMVEGRIVRHQKEKWWNEKTGP